MFVTFEGGEGVGKTTQIARLAATLEADGRRVITTREPGGTPFAEGVRSLLLGGGSVGVTAQALAFYAARADHLDNVIRPALSEGAVVLCDRFHDSTRAYQGAAGGADVELLAELKRRVIGAAMPTITFLLDLDPQIGLARARARSDETDAFEAADLGYHEALRTQFLRIADAEPNRVVVLDASRPADDLATEIAAAFRKRAGAS